MRVLILSLSTSHPKNRCRGEKPKKFVFRQIASQGKAWSELESPAFAAVHVEHGVNVL